jgi:hypothetical protein
VAARERRSGTRRTSTPANPLRPSTGVRMARPLSSPQNKDIEAGKVLMGEIRPSPSPISPNLKLEAALEQWKKAAEGQGLLRSNQRES